VLAVAVNDRGLDDVVECEPQQAPTGYRQVGSLFHLDRRVRKPRPVLFGGFGRCQFRFEPVRHFVSHVVR
jgi:hypothetical protein